MQKNWISVGGLLVSLAAFGHCYDPAAVEQQLSQSYAPIRVDCPNDVEWVRHGTALSQSENDWVANRKRVVASALRDYLERLRLEDFDVDDYLDRITNNDYANVPVMGIAISGGGFTSGFTGAGVMRALDSRFEAAKQQKVGGLLQSMTYMSGLSGGGFPITAFATSNFPLADDLISLWQPQISRYTAENDTQYAATFESMFKDLAEKEKAGFNVSSADLFGRAWSYEFIPGPHGGLNATMSGVAALSNFAEYNMPMPMLMSVSAIDSDPEYYGLPVPLPNSTIFEFTPFEFGSWDEPVQAFSPMKWLGTTLNNGSVVNQSECVLGFDRSSFTMGAAGSALGSFYIQDTSNGTLDGFAKRSDDASLNLSSGPILPRQSSSGGGFSQGVLNKFIDAFNETLHLPLSQIIYAWIPNPFAGVDSVSADFRGPSLRLVDGSESRQGIPLWPQIQPDRNNQFIIAWDAINDAEPYNWSNGTNLYDTYLRANEVGIPFPVIPPASTFVANNYSTRPVFFGCDISLTTTQDARSPIVAYFANSPYSAYTNYSSFQTSTSVAQLEEVWLNSFNYITQGNGTLDEEWPMCLGCAALERSLVQVGLERTEQCKKCLRRYCWDGTNAPEDQSTVVDPSLILDPSLGFLEWQKTNPY